MTEGLTRSLRIIHQLERSIRVLELVRDETQQAVDEKIAGYEGQGVSPETDPIVAKARIHIDTCNRVILNAKEQIIKLERGD